MSAANIASAESRSISLPFPQMGGGGSDSISTSDGARCTQSNSAQGPYLDMGVGVARGDEEKKEGRDEEVFAYTRVIVPLGKKRERLDCTRLYELELKRLRMELDMLKMGSN